MRLRPFDLKYGNKIRVRVDFPAPMRKIGIRVDFPAPMRILIQNICRQMGCSKKENYEQAAYKIQL